MEICRIEKENQEYLNQKKLFEITHSKTEADAKRLEMEEKRNEDLLQSFLRAKKRRVCQLIAQKYILKQLILVFRYFKDLFLHGLI
jgi:hypothetical protein